MAARRGPLPRKPTANARRTVPDPSTSARPGVLSCIDGVSSRSDSPASRCPFPVAAPVATLLSGAGGRLRPAPGVSASARCLGRLRPSPIGLLPADRERQSSERHAGAPLPVKGLQGIFSPPHQICALDAGRHGHSKRDHFAAGISVAATAQGGHGPTVPRAPCQYKDKWPSAKRRTLSPPKFLVFCKRAGGRP